MAGFNMVKTQSQGGTTGIVSTFAVAAAHLRLIAPGDVVVLQGTADAEGISEVDTETPGVISTFLTGIVDSVDVQIEGENLTETGLPATTAGKLKVRVDQFALYEVDTDTPLVIAQVGLNAAYNATAATKSGGLTISNMTLDAATAAATQTLPFRIVALLEDTAGVLGNRALVRVNATTASDGAAGV